MNVKLGKAIIAKEQSQTLKALGYTNKRENYQDVWRDADGNVVAVDTFHTNSTAMATRYHEEKLQREASQAPADAARESEVELIDTVSLLKERIAELESERDGLQLSVHGLQAQLAKKSQMALNLAEENAALKKAINSIENITRGFDGEELDEAIEAIEQANYLASETLQDSPAIEAKPSLSEDKKPYAELRKGDFVQVMVGNYQHTISLVKLVTPQNTYWVSVDENEGEPYEIEYKRHELQLLCTGSEDPRNLDESVQA